jgi:hypothetical protein
MCARNKIHAFIPWTHHRGSEKDHLTTKGTEKIKVSTYLLQKSPKATFN